VRTFEKLTIRNRLFILPPSLPPPPSLLPSLPPSLGVYRNSETLKYEAYLDLPLGRLFLGVFEGQEEAARAYDQSGLLYFEFPAMNFDPITGKRNRDRLFALHR